MYAHSPCLLIPSRCTWLINNVQSLDKLTNKPNAMESAQSYFYYSHQICCLSVETWPPPGGRTCNDMNKETSMDDIIDKNFDSSAIRLCNKYKNHYGHQYYYMCTHIKNDLKMQSFIIHGRDLEQREQHLHRVSSVGGGSFPPKRKERKKKRGKGERERERERKREREREMVGEGEYVYFVTVQVTSTSWLEH